MAKQYSKYQQKIIKSYYDNREAISLQRLGELVTDLYLAEGKARETKWKQAIRSPGKTRPQAGSYRAPAQAGTIPRCWPKWLKR